ncbi:hypothetical protein PINS_up013456 [Pythium insidiosum]|nr:hypothetical protein PINS_up013456 [Pythium insidiosum]
MLNDMLVAVDAAWLCAAERDMEREEEEREALLRQSRRRNVKGKYELDTAAQLDRDLKEQQLVLRRRAAKRKSEQLPLRLPFVREPAFRPLVDPQRQPNDSPTNNPRGLALDVKSKRSVYERENQRLAALLNDKPRRRGAVGGREKKKLRPRIVDDLLSLERRTASSAQRVQRWWRAHLRRVFWRAYVVKVRAAVQIQRIARGFLCRCVFRVWHGNRTTRATRIQAAFRGLLTRRVIATWKQWEYVNAARIQAIIRGHAARRRTQLRQRRIAAVRIQALWRGHRTRRRTDLQWLATKATSLQRLIRGVLTRRRVRRLQTLLHTSAMQIQRMFRGVLAREKVERLLRDRETENRHEVMRMLEVEEEWHQHQRDRLQARLQRLRIFEQLCDLEEQYYRAHERVNDLEAIYLDMKTQRLRVSPRAIEQGWVEEMESKMRKQREMITHAKLDVIFSLGLAFKQKEEEYLELMHRIQDMEEKRQRFEIWQDEEFLDYWERECRHQHEVRERERRRRIADEKRKWRITFYHLNGKRDKRWRGTHWTPDVLEDGKRRQIFTLNQTNLLALIEEKWRRHLDAVSNEDDGQRRRQQLEEQAALVTATAQVEQTQQIFDPVFEAIESRFQTVKTQQQRRDAKSEMRRRLRARQKAIDAERQAAGTTTDAKDERRQTETRSDRLVRRRKLAQQARVPWHMLDQLAAERKKLEEEKAMFETWKRVPLTLFPRPKTTSST